MTDKPKFEHRFAKALSDKLVAALAPACERILICGSLRRLKPQVGDIEIVYIPKIEPEIIAESLFRETRPVNRADIVIDGLIASGTLEKRMVARPLSPLPRGEGQGEGQTGSVWGQKNKLARLTKTGVPVDLFATTPEAWFNYIVCRTGSADTNTRIASLANQRGYTWNPYGTGFTSLGADEPFIVRAEADVFSFVGLPWMEPNER